jgi:signal transduction histidine kinase
VASIAPPREVPIVAAVHSLRSRLFVLWLLSLAASLAVGVLLVGLYRQSAAVRLSGAEQTVAAACDAIAERYGYYAAGWAGPPSGQPDAAFRADLATVVDFALSPYPGIAGGIWQPGAGALASTAVLSEQLRGAIATLAAQVSSDDEAAVQQLSADGATLVLQACPLRGPVPALAAFTLARVEAAPAAGPLRLGLGILLVLVLAITGLLTWLVAAWSRRIGAIETALARHAGGPLPQLRATGERELDRIVSALNLAGERLEAERRRSEALAARVALAERLAALGRVAAGVAHEIRNPIAAMRLKAENALAGDDARRRAALDAILAQIARLDRLLTELLAMTQPREPAPAPTDLTGLLEACAADHHAAGVTLHVEADAGTARIDAGIVRRVLDVLVDNAVYHTPPGGVVMLGATRAGDTLRITVVDTGPGVYQDLRHTLFEPFVSGRPEGTGLGLAIARELAEAHGGRLSLSDPGGDAPGVGAPGVGAPGRGATFTLEIPCPLS